MTFLKILRFSDDLCLSSCPKHRSSKPKSLSCRLFEDFGLNQLVVQIVEIVLHFAVGQFAVDGVAEVVVVIGRTVVGFQAVVGDGGATV